MYIRHCCNIPIKITKGIDADKHVYYSDFVEADDLWDDENFVRTLQKGASLGSKMCTAFEEAFAAYKQVIIIGSDCYDISTKTIEDAFNMLNSHDVVVGPATDGGYYLLGTKQFLPQLFEGKKYSTAHVLKELLIEIRQHKLSLFQLPTLNDIDTFEDLKKSTLVWE